jgi:hypothetical protein
LFLLKFFLLKFFLLKFFLLKFVPFSFHKGPCTSSDWQECVADSKSSLSDVGHALFKFEKTALQDYYDTVRTACFITDLAHECVKGHEEVLYKAVYLCSVKNYLSYLFYVV